jgi:hypothetical protein
MKKYSNKVDVTHIDGVTKVKAKLFFDESKGFHIEYKHKDKGEKKSMSYSRNLTMKECHDLDLIIVGGENPECTHPRSERTYVGEGYLTCKICGETFK